MLLSQQPVRASSKRKKKQKRIKFMLWERVRRITDELDQIRMADEHGIKGPLHNWADEVHCKSGLGKDVLFHRYDNSKIRWR